MQDAKRVLGFSPIDSNDLACLNESLHLNDDSLLKNAAVRDFLIREMNVPRNVSDSLKIVRTFTPAKQVHGWTTLYAEFYDTNAVDLINQYVINLQPGKSVNMYVPHSLYPRFRSINTIAHSYRNGDIKHKTKVRYGISDFVLLVKPRLSNSRWSYVSLAHLPSLELSPYDGNPSSDPPPGRTRLSSKRSRSDSPDTINKVSKARTEQDPTSVNNHLGATSLGAISLSEANKNILIVDDAGSLRQSLSPCSSFYSANSATEAQDLN